MRLIPQQMDYTPLKHTTSHVTMFTNSTIHTSNTTQHTEEITMNNMIQLAEACTLLNGLLINCAMSLPMMNALIQPLLTCTKSSTKDHLSMTPPVTTLSTLTTQLAMDHPKKTLTTKTLTLILTLPTTTMTPQLTHLNTIMTTDITV
jgi:hypothetical protein